MYNFASHQRPYFLLSFLSSTVCASTAPIYAFALCAMGKNIAGVEKTQNMKRKMYQSGNYVLVHTMAELAWLGMDPFLKPGMR